MGINMQAPAIATPTPPAAELELNVPYETVHNKVRKVVYPHKVKGDSVWVRRTPDAVDSAKIPRAKFDRFYKRIS